MPRPYPGDMVVMPSMGDDVSIRICDVPQEQPRSDEGIYTIVDQYAETHAVELDGDTWVTCMPGTI